MSLLGSLERFLWAPVFVPLVQALSPFYVLPNPPRNLSHSPQSQEAVHLTLELIFEDPGVKSILHALYQSGEVAGSDQANKI
jgi:hypothetical protein